MIDLQEAQSKLTTKVFFHCRLKFFNLKPSFSDTFSPKWNLEREIEEREERERKREKEREKERERERKRKRERKREERKSITYGFIGFAKRQIKIGFGENGYTRILALLKVNTNHQKGVLDDKSKSFYQCVKTLNKAFLF